MGAQGLIAQDQFEQQRPRWSLATRVAFRFCFIYFTLFSIATQIFGGLFPIPNVDVPDPSTLWPMRQIVFWTARHVFRIMHPLVYNGSGSGDKTFDWVLSFCLLVFATLATIIWSALDRKRDQYITLQKWFRLFIRFALAAQLIVYGISKVVPLQMPFPYLTTLLDHFGNFLPMGVLWSFVGASPAYEIFAGAAEMLGGILLIAPRTTTFGALVCLADMVHVFMLNMTYDVPVKLFSFHLILMSLFLLAPEYKRFANFFFLNRAAEPSAHPPLFRSRRANRIALAAQIAFGIVLVGLNAYGSWHSWYEYGGGSPKSPLYGIWDVEQHSIDGQLRSPLLNDYGRWRRVIFDSPSSVSFQRMDDSFAYFPASIDTDAKTITLTKSSNKNWKANFTFARPAKDQLILDGDMDGHKTHLQLQLADLDKFLLVRRRFHWIQEYPYTR